MGFDGLVTIVERFFFGALSCFFLVFVGGGNSSLHNSL